MTMIDIPYIKEVLEVEVEDEKIAFLVKHYFDYICEHINVDTSLEEEEISLEALKNPIDNPSLTLFQEAIISAVACNLSTLGISISTTFFDTCDYFENCLNRLTDFLNNVSNVTYLRQLLRIPEEEVTDTELEFLLNHYTTYLTQLLPEADVESPLFKQAVFLSVACHLFKTNPEIISTPTMYYVDEVRERFQIDFDKYGNTWCDLANSAIADLKKKTYGYYGLKVFDRPGARTKYGGYGPEAGR